MTYSLYSLLTTPVSIANPNNLSPRPLNRVFLCPIHPQYPSSPSPPQEYPPSSYLVQSTDLARDPHQASLRLLPSFPTPQFSLSTSHSHSHLSTYPPALSLLRSHPRAFSSAPRARPHYFTSSPSHLCAKFFSCLFSSSFFYSPLLPDTSLVSELSLPSLRLSSASRDSNMRL